MRYSIAAKNKKNKQAPDQEYGAGFPLLALRNIPMPLSTSDIAIARETANKILEELQLDAYVFEIEPVNENWELKIECACEIDGSWQSFTIQVPRQMLMNGLVDDTAKRHLFEYWKKKLVACKVQQT